MKKVLRIALGILLMIVGIFALLTPFTPGSWLALIGLEILGLRLVVQRKFLSLLPEKYRRKVNDFLDTKMKKRRVE